MWTEKKSSFLGSPRDVFRRPSAAPEPIAPTFLHTTFPSKYFVLAEFYPPRLSFGGSYAAEPLWRIVTLCPAIYYMAGHNEGFVVRSIQRNRGLLRIRPTTVKYKKIKTMSNLKFAIKRTTIQRSLQLSSESSSGNSLSQ